MPFYKKQDGQLVSGEFIDGSGYTLSEAGKDEYSYPVDGWYWFTDLDAAIVGIANPSSGQSVTMRQARLALHTAGLLETVTAAVAAAGPTVQIEWEYATSVDRNWPTLAALQAALGLSDAQIDDLFTLAASL